jgi:hypothetical protein
MKIISKIDAWVPAIISARRKNPERDNFKNWADYYWDLLPEKGTIFKMCGALSRFSQTTKVQS